MENFSDLGRRCDNIVQTRQLLELGASSHTLTRAVRAGVLTRIRNGWYALPGADPRIIRAVRVGGRLAGVSAAAFYGLATPQRHPLHVQVAVNAARLRPANSGSGKVDVRRAPGCVIHWEITQPMTEETRLVVDLHDCLRQVIANEGEDDAVACVDSALRKGMLDIIDRELLKQALPARLRYVVDVADGRSDGYPESVARRQLARAGIVATPQVNVLDERWIDLLIGDRLALEINGAGKYTKDMTEREVALKIDADHKRIAFLEALGYHVIQLSYDMVVNDWDATLSMILAVMERGDHLHRPKLRLS